MDKQNTKEVMFQIWDELIFLLEELYKKQPDDDIKDLIDLQREKLISKEISHSRLLKIPININNSLLDSTLDNIEKSVILKWEELVIQSYFYLQESRIHGGTLGHKAGPVWFFQRETKEKYKENILKLRYL